MDGRGVGVARPMWTMTPSRPPVLARMGVLMSSCSFDMDDDSPVVTLRSGGRLAPLKRGGGDSAAVTPARPLM
jgi:hypothetical protein